VLKAPLNSTNQPQVLGSKTKSLTCKYVDCFYCTWNLFSLLQMFIVGTAVMP